ncbi:putative enzyme related to lactoylglutathione lyase [Paucibacter oligotrophus]|uniref:Putative enzyme related to lactoylglutathione lyase n=1 Tax=Roseateles oligotrophus TaxID=1769250 RepID=A0A840L8Y3_9BURK|nr:VOC family protein [Roseateles oligotrophus]MBB4843215.1 putative enzyme related to lactoylglutathione lyase [Roseateles oligotrophus]
MNSYVEHAQIFVVDLDRTATFYLELFPEWRIRGRGREVAGSRRYNWIHIGDDHTYLAFRGGYEGMSEPAPSVEKQCNHVGIVVPEIAEKERVLRQLGAPMVRSTHPARVRVYTRDPDGYEIELIQYLSEEVGARNDYDWCVRNGITAPVT